MTRPQDSAVRSSLAIIRSVAALDNPWPTDRVGHARTIMLEAKKLRADQIDDVCDHLAALFADEDSEPVDAGESPSVEAPLPRAIADSPQA